MTHTFADLISNFDRAEIETWTPNRCKDLLRSGGWGNGNSFAPEEREALLHRARGGSWDDPTTRRLCIICGEQPVFVNGICCWLECELEREATS